VAKHLRKLLAALLLLLGLPALANSAETEQAAGLYQAMTCDSLEQLPGLRALDLVVGGWMSAGVTYNNYSPADHSNGTVTFNDRAGEFQLDQLNLFIERAVDKDAKKWSIGGRLDVM